MSTRHALPLGLGLLALVTACYTQRPLTMPVPAPETRIVAAVTDSGIVVMSNALGPGALEVEGVIAAADASFWDLRMLRVDYRGGASIDWNHELIRFPRSALANPTERQLDKRRSWFLAGFVTGTALLAARVFGAIGGGESPNTPPPPPN